MNVRRIDRLKTSIPGSEFVAHMDQLAGSRLVEVVDGSGAGQRVIEVWNSVGLQVEVLPDRGFDLFSVRYKGTQISWFGPSGLRGAEFHEPTAFGWLRTFHGGLLTTCGLEHFGNPVRRAAPEYFPPDDRQIEFGEHGRIGHQRSDLTRRELIVDGDRQRILLAGLVRQAALYSEQFELRREISVLVDSPAIQITDVVTNVGPVPTTVALLYHINFGYPLVAPGTIISFESSQGPKVVVFPELAPANQERVSPLEIEPGRDGVSKVVVESSDQTLAVEVVFGADSLPNTLLWELPRSKTNALGIAPATAASPDDSPVLSPGESIEFRVAFRVGEHF